MRHRPVAYDYATGSTFSVKINGKPMFLLNDFRKKVDKNVKNAKYVSAFKKALEQQVHDKNKQDAIRDQYDKALVPRFRPVEHTDTGLTKNMLGLNTGAGDDETPPVQGEIGHSRIDKIDPWENSSGGGLEKYSPCVTSVFAPVQYQNLDDTHPQWQREPSTHLSLDFVYGYQGASCWDQELFGEGPGMDNLHYVQNYDPFANEMKHTGEIVYFAAATVIVFDIKNNIQRYLHHSDDVTACTILKRVVQKPDGSWEECMAPTGAQAKEQWAKFFAYDKGIYTPSDVQWSPASRLLPQSSDEFPQFDNGVPMDWRDWDLPNRCIVATGQKGRNPRIYVWRIVRLNGELNMEKQVLATMSMGPKRLQASALSFNSRGNYLVGLATDFDHTICVFDWKNKGGPQLIREGSAHGGTVDTCKFNPYSESAFASCGEKHLKFWELGDSDLEMAAGLFGDLGEPLDQRTVAFNPRGNAISGVKSGDIYVWSSGTVQAKYANAHKENVIGLLYVDKIGLFSCGKGGLLKMWDPELADTTNPLCCVDLKAFTLQGDPKLTAKTAGRAMDWTTSQEFLQYVDDDTNLEDDPSKGVRGAPATHMSFRDLKAEGCLMIGMTDNTILLLGFRRTDSGDWTKGMKGEEQLEGDSHSCKKEALSQQDWWTNKEVQKYTEQATKWGCTKGTLPIACYWYQKFEESKPGYMPSGANSKGCPWKWAVCGKKAAMRSHHASVDSVSLQPDERIFMSVAKDCTARFFDINDQKMIDCAYVHKPARSAVFWSKTEDGVVVASEEISKKKCTVFTIGHEDGSFSVWHTDKTAAEAADQDDSAGEADKNPFYDPENAFGGIYLLCSNPLPRPAPTPTQGISGTRAPSEQAFSVQYSPDGRYFVVALGDNCVDVYKHAIKLIENEPTRNVMKEYAKQKALGYSEEEIERQKALPYKRVGCCNDHSSAVLNVDFDSESLYIRTTSQSRELLYAFVPSGKQCLKTEELSKKKWTTHNNTLGWSVKSIWAKGSSGNDINSIDRTRFKVPPWAPCHGGANPSPYPYPDGVFPNGSAVVSDTMKTNNFPGEGAPSSWGQYVCATGDDDGKVKLFRWPAFGFKQAFRSYLGHGSHVMQVRFSYDDDYLISAGGSDMSLFQWRHVIHNKIYVQNLPDEKDGTGKYVVSKFQLIEHLEDYFSRFLKFDRSTEVRREQDKDFEEKFKKALAAIADVEPKEHKRLLNVAYSHRDAWIGLDTETEKKVPDRDIVSVSVFNSGAAWKGKAFPSDKSGGEITDRWATVVFKTKDDVDDVVDLHGADNVLRYEKLFDSQIFHLYPLYINTGKKEEPKTNEEYSSKDPKKCQRCSKDKNPSGEQDMEIWEPGGGGYASKGDKPYFLCITPYDPSESPIPTLVHNATHKIQKKMNKEDNANEMNKGGDANGWEAVRDRWKKEQKEWYQIQEWTQSDKPYGQGEKNGFENYDMWSAERKKEDAGQGSHK